ncbi:MAG: glycine/betaine ABC transporter permease [Gemmatales bacterium]|nr:MAG: glycine/betaine ABC transporter permease [Gemmatales bacterium]
MSKNQNDINQADRLSRITLFTVSLPFCALIAAIGIFWPDVFANAVSAYTNTVFRSLDWFYMLSVTGFLLVCLWLALGKYGKVKLGKPDDEPEFTTGSWLAMLFAAGMGVGLLFWGVAEPMIHFSAPPVGEAHTPQAAHQAMVITLLHWGLHAWGIYCIGALVLAYFHYRRGLPYLAGSPIRGAFQGKWVEPVARIADLIAVLAVTFGVAGSLAMGVLQVQTGLHVAAGVPVTTSAAMVILILLFFSYMTSAATSLDKGIKILSNVNMATAIALMVFILFAGPTAFLLRGLVNTLGDYLASLFVFSFRLYPYENLADWMGSWTLTYFVWWIAWTPFVGIFVARISRGRTIREFVVGVILAPSLFSVIWFSVFGGTGIYEETHGGGGIARIVHEDVTTALFSLFDRLPLSEILTALALVLVYIFVVTSVDSATYVLGMLTSQGSMDPPTGRKLAWGIILAALGGVLVLSGNINVVRAGAISFALPLTLILLIQAGALIRALGEEQPADPSAGT